MSFVLRSVIGGQTGSSPGSSAQALSSCPHCVSSSSQKVEDKPASVAALRKARLISAWRYTGSNQRNGHAEQKRACLKATPIQMSYAETEAFGHTYEDEFCMSSQPARPLASFRVACHWHNPISPLPGAVKRKPRPPILTNSTAQQWGASRREEYKCAVRIGIREYFLNGRGAIQRHRMPRKHK